MTRDMIYCAFCGSTEKECRVIVVGPDGLGICDKCIKLCCEIMKNHDKKEDGK